LSLLGLYANGWLLKIWADTSDSVSDALPVNTYSLSRLDAINKALASNPQINQAKQELENKTGAMWQVRSSLLPTISAYANRTSRDHSTIDRGARDPNQPIDRSPIATQSLSYGIEIRQLVFDGFSSLHRYAQSEYQKDASYWQLIASSFSTISQLHQSYDYILLREGQLSAYQETLNAFKQFFDVVNKRVAVGERTRLDSLRVETELKRAEADYARAMSDLAASEETLKKILQLPESGPEASIFKLEGPLVQQNFEMPIDEALKRASKIHPEIFAAEINRDAAKMSLRSAYGSYLPKIEGFARYGVNTSYASFDQDLEGWTLGISGNWTLFDSFGREGAIRSQRASLMSSEIQLSDQRYQLISRVRQLYAQKEALNQALSARMKAVEVAEIAVTESQKRYELGEVDIEMLIDAQRAYQSTLLDREQSLFDYNSTIYQLQYVVALEPVKPTEVLQNYQGKLPKSAKNTR
jgi:outer membrane protein